jgi:hypothetical protein
MGIVLLTGTRCDPSGVGATGAELHPEISTTNAMAMIFFMKKPILWIFASAKIESESDW